MVFRSGTRRSGGVASDVLAVAFIKVYNIWLGILYRSLSMRPDDVSTVYRRSVLCNTRSGILPPLRPAAGL